MDEAAASGTTTWSPPPSPSDHVPVDEVRIVVLHDGKPLTSGDIEFRAQLTTIRADGRPHQTTIAGIWLDDRFSFSTGRGEQKAKNLEAGRHVIVTAGNSGWDGMDVILEGDAVDVTDAVLRPAFTQTITTGVTYATTPQETCRCAMPDMPRFPRGCHKRLVGLPCGLPLVRGR